MHKKQKLQQVFVSGIVLQVFALSIALLFSCKKNAEEAPVPVVQEPVVQKEQTLNHWLYFHTGAGGTILKPADTVAEIPPVDFLPWTEAVHVADAGFYGEPVFLVNKCGIYGKDDLTPNAPLPVQHPLFSLASAGGLYHIGNAYNVRMYQNTVFSSKTHKKNTCFLLKRNKSSKMYTVAAESAWLNIPKEAQCTALQQVHNKWYACFKLDDGNAVSFYYLRCNDADALTKEDAFKDVTAISREEFREAFNPVSYNLLPALLKNMADAVDNTEPLYIRFFPSGAVHNTVFRKPAVSSGTMREISDAYAFFSKNENQEPVAALLLADGTLILNSGETGLKRLQLPVLPRNFVYSYFFLADNRITAAWEEQPFFEVGRSGLFTARLDELL